MLNGSIDKSLNFAKHDVIHITLVLETDYLASQQHITRLPPNTTKMCWAMQANTFILCNAKVGIGKHDIVAPTYKGLKELHSTNNVKYEFWLCLDNIKRRQEEICCILAYDTQDMVSEDRYEPLKGKGVCARRCRVPIVAK